MRWRYSPFTHPTFGRQPSRMAIGCRGRDPGHPPGYRTTRFAAPPSNPRVMTGPQPRVEWAEPTPSGIQSRVRLRLRREEGLWFALHLLPSGPWEALEPRSLSHLTRTPRKWRQYDGYVEKNQQSVVTTGSAMCLPPRKTPSATDDRG